MQNNYLLKQLETFLKKAMCSTYAAASNRAASQRLLFEEYAYQEGDWSYRDRYAGYLQSWGQEIIWYKNKPLWSQIYGGGLENPSEATRALAAETFKFLKLALSSKETGFQPRGPAELKERDWIYKGKWTGNIMKFQGSEKIFHKSTLVFTHSFMGGLFISNQNAIID